MPYLVVSKHQSAWDTFGLVPLFRDPAIVLKDELKWIPFYGWFCVKFEHILVKRDKAAKALKQLTTDAQARAAQGREIVIFPEGTRQAPGAPPDYKPGYVALYEALELPCVPLGAQLRPLLAPPQHAALPRHYRRRIPRPDPGRHPRKEFRKILEARLGGSCPRLLSRRGAACRKLKTRTNSASGPT